MPKGTEMKPATGATPLIAIAAAAVDTETTGLDATKARVVQIGAVGIARGKVVREPQFSLLIDPGEAIPSEASRIHGITDADVDGAGSFLDAWAQFQEFVGDRILVGHSIGFDLAVLERECRHARLPWKKPRALCVRLLATIANPNLADHSLETIAAWLRLEITGRHSALGDAIAAGDIFAALIPELRKRNIRTLGEAEVACLALSHALEAGHRAGWAEPVSRPQAPAFQPVDPYAYRHRVGSLMSEPPVVVKSTKPTRQVIDLMVKRKIGSVLVSDRGTPHRPIGEYGIVTERDLMRRISSDAERVFDLPIGSIATRPLISIRAAAFAYRAIGRMDRLKIRHLAVRDDEGMLVGMLSARDLLRLRAAAAIYLDDTIEHAKDATELADAWAMLPGVARSLIGEEIDPRVVAEIISEELCSLTRRAAVLAEQQMQIEGHGPPPCAYAMLVLGSGGRGESLMAPDQDNAIVFAHGEPDGPEDSWFKNLGAKLADMLDISGVPYCKGGVMAANAAFRGSLDTWKGRVEDWVRRLRPEDLLNVDIVYDLRPVHGDTTLAAQFIEHAYDRGHAEPVFAKLLGERITTGNPFTLFGRFQLENGRLDLKRHGLFPIVATARTLAIRHGIRERSTRARFERLIALDIGGDRDMKAMLAGHAMLIGLLLGQQTQDIYAGIPASNHIEINALTREQQVELKSFLKRLQSAPDLVRDLMFA
jgi:CBS domain-containing protein